MLLPDSYRAGELNGLLAVFCFGLLSLVLGGFVALGRSWLLLLSLQSL